MFPVQFARDVIDQLSDRGDDVLDPFCGRGTTTFVARATGRPSIGVDTNPVAWIFAEVKINPHPSEGDLLVRVGELLDDIQPGDKDAENDFQRNAWSKDVLAFLQSARRNLDWVHCGVDRTLMALTLIHLHAKLGEGLSNQMRQSKAMAPNYSVRWWKNRNLLPPEIDIQSFFRKKIAWRYAKGLPPAGAEARIFLGDARKVLGGQDDFRAKLILTSPPYCGVTDYAYDNWIRLWLMGGPALPDHSNNARFSNREDYGDLISGVLSSSKEISSDDVTVFMRTSAQEFSTKVAIEALRENWPNHGLACRFDKAPGGTQTALFGNSWEKKGEVDIIAFTDRVDVPPAYRLLVPA